MIKYNFILLPPDGFQMTIKDKLCDENLFFNQIVNFFYKNKKINEKILIKYRSNHQKKRFPNKLIESTEKGKLLDLCDDNTCVIGPVNSATIECLHSKINYFCYRYDPGLHENLSIFCTLDKVLYVSNNISEIQENFQKKKIFRDNYSINDVTHKNGFKLNQIAEKILKDI